MSKHIYGGYKNRPEQLDTVTVGLALCGAKAGKSDMTNDPKAVNCPECQKRHQKAS